jgi:hypothetical protein
MVFPSIHLLSFPSFMSVQHLVVGFASSVLAICVDCFCYVGYCGGCPCVYLCNMRGGVNSCGFV